MNFKLLFDRHFNIGKVLFLKNKRALTMFSDFSLLMHYFAEPLFHTLFWLGINTLIEHKIQHIAGFKGMFLIYISLTQWFCLVKVLRGSTRDLSIYHYLQCVAKLNFRDIAISKTFVYFMFYQFYIFTLVFLYLFITKTPVNLSWLLLIGTSTIFWFLEIVLIKIIFILLNALYPFIAEEVERTTDRFFYFSSSLFYTAKILSPRAREIISFNPLYQYTTILKMPFDPHYALLDNMIEKQLITLCATFVLCVLLLGFNRFSMKKTKPTQMIHLNQPF